MMREITWHEAIELAKRLRNNGNGQSPIPLYVVCNGANGDGREIFEETFTGFTAALQFMEKGRM